LSRAYLSFQLKASLKTRVSAIGFPKQFMRLFVKLLIGILACTVLATAQTSGGRPSNPTTSTNQPATENLAGSIRGRVVLPNGSSLSQAVRITAQNMRGTPEAIFTDNQGQFEFRNLTPGDYTLEVEGDRLQFEVTTERVQVLRGAPSVVTIALKEKSSAVGTKPAGNVVSVGEIGPDVPAKARKEFERASKSAREGKALEAIDHLRKAISIYPNFMMAHNDLGAELLVQGNLDEATTELQRAIQIDPKAFNPYLNLGVVLVRQKRFAEAADLLRKALSLESDSPDAKLYLGLALMGTNDLEGAERELKAAYNLGGSSYSLALFHLGEVYMNRGERALARQALETYLHNAPNAANAVQARKLISILQ
jgi:Flp pilus assembly protein TadD